VPAVTAFPWSFHPVVIPVCSSRSVDRELVARDPEICDGVSRGIAVDDDDDDEDSEDDGGESDHR
jgi:hypothetical protein